MDAFGSLGCLLVGGAIPLGAIFLAVRRGWRQLAVAGAYQDVARQLGLSADTRGISVHGHLGGRRIWVGEVLEGHGPDRRHPTWGLVELDRPLGLGLQLTRRGFGRASSAYTPVDAELAKRIDVRLDDPSVGAALLSPPVEAALLRLTRGWPDVQLTDAAVRVRLRQPEASAAGLRELIDTLLMTAEALEAARASLPAPAGVQGALPAWEAAAAEHGLTLAARWPALEGERAGRRVRLVARRVQGGWGSELRLWFRAHEATGLRLFPQRGPDGYWSVGQDIQLGEPAFDQAFVVKAWDPIWAAEVLGPDARAALLQLHDGELELDDQGLVVRALPLSPDGLGARLDAATRLADALGW